MIEKIKEYMKKKGITQYEFASIIKVPPQTVNRWLNKKCKISNGYKQILERLLNVY